MALRIRKDGRILCAALHEEQSGDIYLSDDDHYRLSAELKAIVTQTNEQHRMRGEWWWRNQVPKEVVIEPFYLE